ncbi:DgyrCDS4800 [Dimorphilus gyrociliatus]|uniref:Protection of telomeres protein 1 n=1 Tax=Dimorphilus gyrociliatus TaxID=2664684 RepID=A0A7I8VHN5_9ANNE|nr:DgyrCDS4800 [Dimorphilus gyrociliatus]
MTGIREKIQIFQTANPLESARQFLINKKNIEIIKINDLKVGEEYESKWIVGEIKEAFSHTKKFDWKKIILNDPDNEDQMIECFLTKEYSRILDAIEPKDVLIFNKALINASANVNSPHEYKLETNNVPPNLTEVWVFISEVQSLSEDVFVPISQLKPCGPKYNICGIIVFSDCVKSLKNDKYKFFLKLIDTSGSDRRLGVTLFSQNEADFPFPNKEGEILIIKRMECKLFNEKLQCVASDSVGAAWAKFSGDITELRKFWESKKPSINSSGLKTSVEFAISDLATENFPFTLRCKILAIIERGSEFLLKIWDGTKAQLYVTLYYKVGDFVCLSNLTFELCAKSEKNEKYIYLNDDDASSIEVLKRNIGSLYESRGKVKGDNFGTISHRCYTDFVCQLIGKMYSPNIAERLSNKKFCCVLVAWDGTKGLKFSKAKVKEDEVEEINNSICPDEEYLHYIFVYDEHAEKACKIKLGEYIEVTNADIRKKAEIDYYEICVHGNGKGFNRDIRVLNDDDPRVSIIKMFQRLVTVKPSDNANNSNNKTIVEEDEEDRILLTQDVDTEIRHDGSFISLKKLKKSDRQPGICKIEAYISSFTSIENHQFIQLYCNICSHEEGLINPAEDCIIPNNSIENMFLSWEKDKMEENDFVSLMCPSCFKICVNHEKEDLSPPFLQVRMKFKINLQDNQDHLAVELSGDDARDFFDFTGDIRELYMFRDQTKLWDLTMKTLKKSKKRLRLGIRSYLDSNNKLIHTISDTVLKCFK